MKIKRSELKKLAKKYIGNDSVDAQNQLSGLGFSLTQRNEVLVKVKTNHVESVMKVKF